jgi:putative methanogenesis marker 13 metalloprotein
MSENDFIFGASQKLEETLKKVEEMFQPKLVGIVGTCASMIIGEDLKEAVENADINAQVLAIESHGGLSEGDNTEGAIAVLDAAEEDGIISAEERKRQTRMLKKATEIEKTRGMAQGEYIKPSYGDLKEKVGKLVLSSIKNGDKVALVLNAKKETSYLFSHLLKLPFKEFNPENTPLIIGNLDDQIGLPRIRQHARNIKEELKKVDIEVDYITGGLDEYPITGEKVAEILRKKTYDLVVVAGVPHAVPINTIPGVKIAVTDGPRLVEPLKKMGYDYVVTELDAHSKTLGTSKIVPSDFGMTLKELMIR